LIFFIGVFFASKSLGDFSYNISQSNEVQNYLRLIITACTSLEWEWL